MSTSPSRPELNRPAQRSFNCRLFRVRLAAFALAFTVNGIASPTFARSNFDGQWSVVIETRGRACPPTVRYPVAIGNGVVSNAGDVPVAVTGQVTPTGIVRVTVQSGGSWASGSGRLTATNGSGVWRGQGPNGSCAGTWQAERRRASDTEGRAGVWLSPARFAPLLPRLAESLIAPDR